MQVCIFFALRKMLAKMPIYAETGTKYDIFAKKACKKSKIRVFSAPRGLIKSDRWSFISTEA